MTTNSGKWIEEARRQLDQCGYPAEEVDNLLAIAAEFNALDARALMISLKSIAFVLHERGHADISTGLHQLASLLAERVLGRPLGDGGEGKDGT